MARVKKRERGRMMRGRERERGRRMMKGKRGNNIVLIKNTCLVQRPAGRLVPLHNSGTERIKLYTYSSAHTFLVGTSQFL
jgi:hypothetical protein